MKTKKTIYFQLFIDRILTHREWWQTSFAIMIMARIGNQMIIPYFWELQIQKHIWMLRIVAQNTWRKYAQIAYFS